jgi:hypothetical protein
MLACICLTPQGYISCIPTLWKPICYSP